MWKHRLAEKAGTDHLVKGQLKCSCVVTSRILSNLLLITPHSKGYFYFHLSSTLEGFILISSHSINPLFLFPSAVNIAKYFIPFIAAIYLCEDLFMPSTLQHLCSKYTQLPLGFRGSSLCLLLFCRLSLGLRLSLFPSFLLPFLLFFLLSFSLSLIFKKVTQEQIWLF